MTNLPTLVEAAVRDHLTAALTQDPVPVDVHVPDPRPDRFVRLLRTGTRTLSLVHTEAQITLDCWAPTMAQAWDLTATVYEAMCALDTAGLWVPRGARGWVGGPAYLPDPLTASPRYTMTALVRSCNQQE